MSEVKRITVGPEQARVWLEKYKQDVQRPPRRKWVVKLAESMKAGAFDPNSTIHLRVLDGETHLIDGRQRLMAVMESQTTQPFYVVTDKVKTYQELLKAFRSVNEGKAVTNTDYFAALSLDTETGLSRVELRYLSSAVPFIADGFSNSSNRDIELDRRVELMRQYSEAAYRYFLAVVGATPLVQTKLKWASCVAVGVVTFDESIKVYGEQRVTEFWEGVARMMNSHEGDPRGLASRHLVKTIPSRSNGNVDPGQEMRSPFYTARFLANCFNAWVEGRTLSKTYPDVSKPIQIKGSRFKG